MKIFIVDDSNIVAERLKTIITEIDGLDCVGFATNAKDAVEAILRNKPNIVILDIRLRGENGINVLDQIRKEKPAPICIMLTNYPYPQYRKKCAELGADYFFDKVAEFGDFLDVLKTLACNHARRQDRKIPIIEGNNKK